MHPPSLPRLARTHITRLLLLTSATSAACTGSDSGGSGSCKGLEAAVGCGPAAPKPATNPLPAATSPAITRIYVDRSGSMAGYLDREFEQRYGVGAGSQSLRYVIDRVLAGDASTDRRIYGYGTRITSIPAPSNQDVSRTLVRQDFYTDNNTRLEDVLDSVSADAQREGVHIVVGDGR